MIHHELARRVGVNRDVPPEVVAEYLVRQAGSHVIDRDIPHHAALWFIRLGTLLVEWTGTGWHYPDSVKTPDEIAKNVASEAIIKLHRHDAPAVLAILIPEQVVPQCAAADLAKACKGLVNRHLPGICRRILDTWWRDGHLSSAIRFDDTFTG